MLSSLIAVIRPLCSRVYVSSLPQKVSNTEFPAVTIHIGDETRDISNSGSSKLVRSTVYVEVWGGYLYANAWTLRESIRTALHCFAGTLSGVSFQLIELRNSQNTTGNVEPGSDNLIHRIQDTYDCHWRET